MERGSKGAASLADLVIAVAYFLIPLELLLYLLKRRCVALVCGWRGLLAGVVCGCGEKSPMGGSIDRWMDAGVHTSSRSSDPIL